MNLTSSLFCKDFCAYDIVMYTGGVQCFAVF